VSDQVNWAYAQCYVLNCGTLKTDIAPKV